MNSEYKSLLSEKFDFVKKKRSIIKIIWEETSEVNFIISFTISLFSMMYFTILHSMNYEPNSITTSINIIIGISYIILLIHLLIFVINSFIPWLISLPNKLIDCYKHNKKCFEIISKMPITKEELELIGCKNRQDVYVFYVLAYIYEGNKKLYRIKHPYEMIIKEREIMYQFPITIKKENLSNGLYETLFIKEKTFFDYYDIVNDYKELREYLSKELLETFDKNIKKIEDCFDI